VRVLILTITTGQGHHAAGMSISEALTARGAQVLTIDVYKEISSLLYNGVNKGYLFSTKYVSKPYRSFYNHFERKGKSSDFSVFNLINLLISNKFEEKIRSFNPDFIVCTHVFAAQLVNELKRRGMYLDIPAMGIVTDYTIHPFWEDTSRVEYINLASNLFYHKAKTRGIDKSRLLSFGIPVQEKFTISRSKKDARCILQIPEDKPVILLMGGSMGYGNMCDTVEQIEAFEDDFTLLVVCGRNSKQRRRILDMHPNKNRYVYGFVDNVDVMMDAADCIITKPGGLTITEAMAKKLPMILVNPIPGQEERNVDFLVNNGVALSVKKTFTVGDALYFLFNTSGRLEAIRERFDAISNPNATNDIADFIVNFKKAVNNDDN